MGRRLMAPTRLALGVEQTPVGSSSLASREEANQLPGAGGRDRHLITAPSSHLIASNQSRHPEGRLQGPPRAFGRSKIDKWVNWTVRTRRKLATQAKDMWLVCALLVARHGARRKSSWHRKRRRDFDVFVGIDRVYMVSRSNNGTRLSRRTAKSSRLTRVVSMHRQRQMQLRWSDDCCQEELSCLSG